MEIGYTRKSSLLDKKYREFFIPTILTAMALTMSISVDGLIVGNFLGPTALAAVNLVMPIILLYNTFAVLLGMGAATIIAIAKGRREDTDANDIFTVSWLMLLFVGLLLLALQFTFIEQITQLITSDAVLQPLVQEFLRILFYGTPFMLVCLGSVFFLRTEGKAKMASTVLVLANMINLSLDLVYIGLLGMGIGGSALATVSGYVVGAASLLFYVFAKDRTLHINFKLLSKPLLVLALAKRILISGIPGATNAILVPPKLLCINSIVLAVAGSSGMVALSVCNACFSLLNMFTYGAAQTMNPIIGTLYGEKDFVGIRFVVKKAFQILFFASLLITIVMELFPETILTLFGVKDAADFAIGTLAIRIFSLSLIGRSICLLVMFFCTATEKRKMASTISIVEGFAVLVPSAFFLGQWVGITGVWFSFVLTEFVTLLMIGLYYLYKKAQPTGPQLDSLLFDTSITSAMQVMDLTIRSNIEEAVGLSDKVITFLRNGGVASAIGNKVGLVIEEMAVNIATYGHKHSKKQYYIDVRIKLLQDKFIIILRDDGEWFDPTKYLKDEKKDAPYRIGGIELVAAFAEKVEYSRVLGLNNTIITIKTI